MNVIPLEDPPMHTIEDHKLKIFRRFPKEDTVHLFAAVETKWGKLCQLDTILKYLQGHMK